MITRIIIAFAVLFSNQLFAQPAYSPFLHGVASGDPLTDRVILWTRVSPSDTAQPVTVNWRISTDTNFTAVINSGSFTTDASRDFTVKVDADGLQPGTWYYYDFETGGNHSLIGRTKTAPDGSISQMRFAIATCAKYSKGFFNAYARIGERNDIDAVIHLGDYIYESDDSGDIGRPMEPLARCSTLVMFRTRYAQYRTDPDQVYAQQQYPWINVWDDHETGNNCWQYGSEHFPDSTQFAQIKQDATKAFFEWVPIREDPAHPGRVYRKFQYGNLMDLIMLDTRREGRMKQLDFTDTAIYDSNRTILGHEQYDWLIANLDSSSAQWRIIGQQVMMAPLRFLNNYINPDQWNGYPAERDKLLNHLADSSINNVVVLTGDIHSSWAWDLPNDFTQYDSATHQGSVAVELVTPAIASTAPNLIFPFGPVKQNNPYIQYLDMAHNGYFVLDVTPNKVQGDFYFVATTNQRNSEESFNAGLFTLDGTNYLQRASGASQSTAAIQQQAPLAEGYSPIVSAVNDLTIEKEIAVYPNPTSDNIVISFRSETGLAVLRLFDSGLKMIAEKKLKILIAGLNQTEMKTHNLAAGVYFVSVKTPDGKQSSFRFMVAN